MTLTLFPGVVDSATSQNFHESLPKIVAHPTIYQRVDGTVGVREVRAPK